MTAPTQDRPWLAPMELDPEAVAPATKPAEPVTPPPGTEPTGPAVPLEEAEPPSVPPPERLAALMEPPRAPWGRWLAASLAALVLVAIGFDTWDLLNRALDTSVALGVVVAAAAAGAAFATLGMLVRELRSLKRLRRIEELRADSDRLTEEAPHGQADRFAAALTRLYEGRRDLDPVLERLRSVVTDAHDDSEVVRLIDREVLSVLDRRAYQLVLRASRDTALATALSPAAVLDIAVVLWRNLRLVRSVATLYGARPGYLGSLRLLRRMLGNLAVAGVTESAHHVAVDALGGSLAAAISTRVGQGVINGLLTARVGLTAMHLCRPVPFAPETRPSLGRIRAELLSLPKDVL